MKLNFWPFIIFFLVLTNTVFGQNELLQESIYFESAKNDLSAQSIATLDNLIDSLKKYNNYTIYIKGNTDNVGDSVYNKLLSQKRIEATMNFLISKGVSDTSFTRIAFGEELPIADNSSERGKQMNRRVDIIIFFTRNTAYNSIDTVRSIRELYRIIEMKPQEFTINPTKDTVLRCEKGTLLFIKANSFNIPYSCKTKLITIKVKEDFLKSEMIIDNLSTTSNGQIIETQGMVYTDAIDCYGKKVNLNKGKNLLVFVPTDTIVPQAKIFEGNRTPHDSIMNWTVSNTSVLNDFTIEELTICSNWICGGVTYGCDRCKFFFCRFKRIKIAFKGLKNKEIHKDNVQFRRCQKKLKREIREEKRKKINKPLPTSTTLRDRPDLDSQIQPKCLELEELFKTYSVSNIEALIKAINKPLMDSLGVETIEQLRDTLTKINIKNFEMAYLKKSISYEDFKYYVFNTSRLGWSNVDKFIDINKDSLINFKIDLKIAENIDCKLVFMDRRFVIPSTKIEGKYEFIGVPRGERVWIIALKYDAGEPYLSIEEAIIDGKTHKVNFELYSMEELKNKLKILDF